MNRKTGWEKKRKTGRLVLADGTVIECEGAGAAGVAAGEICFNTAMTGYQEILTDPSYAEQIVTFTFPHIGNVGTNTKDIETTNLSADRKVRGAVFKAQITSPSNYRAAQSLNDWLVANNIVALTSLDTRALTAMIREKGFVNGVVAHDPEGNLDNEKLVTMAREFVGIDGQDLASGVSCDEVYEWEETRWSWNRGYGRVRQKDHHVVVLDYGVKRNILRCLGDLGCRISVVPLDAPLETIQAMNADGFLLSNGPGDPAATGEHQIGKIQALIETGKPVFGICLGHQLLSLAMGAQTCKMHQGHHGANHPVKDMKSGNVEITSMNHGFTVDRDRLPANVEETHISLFDGTNCGIRLRDKPVFSVQYHPEASPGPQDSFYLFRQFVAQIVEQKEGLS